MRSCFSVSTLSVEQFVLEVFPYFQELLVLSVIDVVLLLQLFQLAIEPKLTEGVQVPRFSSPEPEVVSSNSIGERNARHNRLNNIPAQRVISSVLTQHELNCNSSEESLSPPTRSNISFLFAFLDL